MGELAEATQPDLLVPEEDRLEMRGRIKSFEEYLKMLPQVELPLRHYFVRDLYARELTVPKGTLLVGKIHRKEHLAMILKGKVLVLTEGSLRVLEAPLTFECYPGTKRVIYAYEDSIWTTLHPNPANGQDLAMIEEDIIAKDFEELEKLTAEELKQIGDELCHG